jgi:uncharacterized protein YdaU (DUF1376 family)
MAQFSLTFWFAQGKKNLKSVESDSDPSTSSTRSDNDEKLRCIEEVQAHLKSKTVAENKQTNKQTDQKNKRAKHAGSLAQRLHDFKQQPRNQTSLPEPTSNLISSLLTNPTK